MKSPLQLAFGYVPGLAVLSLVLAACGEQPEDRPRDPASQDRVTMQGNGSGGWELRRHGKPLVIRGAGGQAHLDVLVESGGNAVRTWGIDNLTETVAGQTLVERARERDLLIAAGIWVGHQRHGFDYGDPARIASQRDEIRGAVAKWKNEPCIALWGLGNEMEGDGHDVRIWRELEELAKVVRNEDPGRLIMTVVAGAPSHKIKALIEHCPSIDLLGVNAYAGAPGVLQAVREAGWSKPFLLTEFGPRGHWEVGTTEWGAALEPSSKDKASSYSSTYELMMTEGKGSCVGTFAFYWGQKQERTPTWYGMFLKTGEKLPPVDAMAKAWTGRWPANRCPRIEVLDSPVAGGTVAAGETVAVTLSVVDPEGSPVELTWTIAEESTERKTGGDAEAALRQQVVPVRKLEPGRWSFEAPVEPGTYRLYLVARDGAGTATAGNFPFRVR